MTAALAAPSPLRDGELALLPAGPDVAALVLAGSRDPEVTRWTQVPADLTVLDALLVTAGWSMPSATTARFEVWVPDLAPAGMATVWINAEGEAEIGYWLLAAARGSGLATRAVRLLCDWAFGVCELRRLQLATLPGNAASERVARHCGFVPAGTLVRDIKGTARPLDLWVRAAAAVSGR